MNEAVTSDTRLSHLSPRHHHFVWVADPWHYQAFTNNEVVVKAIQEGRVYQQPGRDGIRGGPWMKVWYSADREGNLVGEWGMDIPPMVTVCSRCKSPNTTGAPIWCGYCGIQYSQ